MKKIIGFLLVLVYFTACNQLAENEFILEGTIEGIENGKKAVLETQDETGMGLKALDSVVIKDGKFTFKGTVEEPELRFVQVEGVNGKAVFILENGEINMKIFKDSVNKTITSGTFNNEQFAKYTIEQGKIQKKIMDFRNTNMAKMQDAVKVNDSITINRLRDQFSNLQKELNDYNVTFSEKNPKAFISVLMLENMFYQPDADIEKIKKIYTNLDKTIQSTKPGKKISEMISSFNAAEIGKKAPDFSGPSPDGKTVSLKEVIGKVTIIDFWASWCGPCRKENPNVVALYNEYHDKGLNIIGVSLDKEGDGEKWKQAIEADKLAWPQVSNLKYWNDPIAKKYNIQSIPATFILDANGIIVAKDLRGDQLKAKVKELLGM
jgi:thiol-disulfide isomerase/thioredoxin